MPAMWASGWKGSCLPRPDPSTPVPTKSNATSSPRACSVCRDGNGAAELTDERAMDFTFDEQQIEFHTAVRRFLMVDAAPETLREYWETPLGRSRDMRGTLAEQGVTGISVPEKFGGLGLGDLDWVLILQEVGYHGIPDSLSEAAYLAADVLRRMPAGNRLSETWL